MKNKKDQLLGGSVPAGSAIPERGGLYPTPGPWHYQENSDAYTHIVRDEANRYICGCSQDSGGNAEANARLIAAAPELLATCIVVKAYLGSLEAGTDEDDPLMEMRREFHGPLLAKLDPAIAKATSKPANSDAPAAQSGLNSKGDSK